MMPLGGTANVIGYVMDNGWRGSGALLFPDPACRLSVRTQNRYQMDQTERSSGRSLFAFDEERCRKISPAS